MYTIKNILVAIGMAGLLMSCGGEEKRISVSELPAVNVTVHKIGLSASDVRFLYSGKVVSDDKTVLSTKILGQVKKMLVKEGDKVTKGQLLVQIKSKDIDSKLVSTKASQREAKSSLKNTQRNFDRISNLHAKGSATQRELDDITTALEGTKARLEAVDQGVAELEELMTYVNLRSPINGFVSAKYINTGSMATPGSPILALESLNELKMEINVPEFEIQMFAEGDAVSVRFNAIKDKVYQGIVDKVIPSSAGAQFKVSVLITAADKTVKPGMFGKVSMLKKGSDQLILPVSVIHQRGQLNGVYTVNEQGEAMLRWLRLGKKKSTGYEVLSGLDTGETVIVSSESKLMDGLPIKITKTL